MATAGRKKKIKKVAATGLWTKMKKWFRETIFFVMESVFLWPESNIKSIANFLLPEEGQTRKVSQTNQEREGEER